MFNVKPNENYFFKEKSEKVLFFIFFRLKSVGLDVPSTAMHLPNNINKDLNRIYPPPSIFPAQAIVAARTMLPATFAAHRQT